MPMLRIVSMLAAGTEIVHALGLGSHLVGRSHECDFPPAVRDLPIVTEARVHAETPSGQIDREVKQVLASGESIYRVRADELRRLRPDLIVTQAQCEVCAVSPRDVEAALCQAPGLAPRVVTLNAAGLADIYADIRRVADAAGTAERGEELVARLESRVAAIAACAADRPARPTVACLEWLDPLMAAGNWIPELVELAGAVNLFGTAGQHSPWLSWEQLRDSDPDVIVAMPCGFDLPRARRDMPLLRALPGWHGLSAIRAGRVFLTDGNQYFNRPGPRVVESLEILAELLHPTAFSFGHGGVAWEAMK